MVKLLSSWLVVPLPRLALPRLTLPHLSSPHLSSPCSSLPRSSFSFFFRLGQFQHGQCYSLHFKLLHVNNCLFPPLWRKMRMNFQDETITVLLLKKTMLFDQIPISLHVVLSLPKSLTAKSRKGDLIAHEYPTFAFNIES